MSKTSSFLIITLVTSLVGVVAYNFFYLPNRQTQTAVTTFSKANYEQTKKDIATQVELNKPTNLKRSVLDDLITLNSKINRELQKIPAMSQADEAYMLRLTEKMSNSDQLKTMNPQQLKLIQEELLRINKKLRQQHIKTIDTLKKVDAKEADLQKFGNALRVGLANEPELAAQFVRTVENNFANNVKNVSDTKVSYSKSGFAIAQTYDFPLPEKNYLASNDKTTQMHDCINPFVYIMAVAGFDFTIKIKAKNWSNYYTHQLDKTRCRDAFSAYKAQGNVFSKKANITNPSAKPKASPNASVSEFMANLQQQKAGTKQFNQLISDSTTRARLLRELGKELPKSLSNEIWVDKVKLYRGKLTFFVRYQHKEKVPLDKAKKLRIQKAYIALAKKQGCQLPVIKSLVNSGMAVDMYNSLQVSRKEVATIKPYQC